MRDILMDIYNALIEDNYIAEVVGDNINFNEWPEVSTIDEPYIVIDEVDDPLPQEHADDDNLMLSYLVQVDVYTKVKPGINARTLRNEVSYRISRILKEQLGMTNTSNAKPEYDRDYKLYRSARRYEGVFYREEIKIN